MKELMTKNHCPKCKADFFTERANINQRHGCGEYSSVEWGVEYESGGLPQGEEEEE